MSKHYLETLFSPKSIAVFGASNMEDAMGYVIFKNLLDGGYKGELYAINPKYERVQDHAAYKSLSELGGNPVDLAVIVTPAKTVPAIIQSCGEHGVQMAVIISAGFSETGVQGIKLEKKVIATAKQYNLRVLGPNCLGILRPQTGLNATLFQSNTKSGNFAIPGNLALVSQSGALCAAVLDWDDIGFSTVISVGTSADLDFGDILDYLVSDPQTQGILLYIEGVRYVRSFMSGLRAAARLKPVIVIKSGRHESASNAVKWHSGALVGRNDAFDAALQRAGVVRVYNLGQLFAAAKTIASRYKAPGNRLAIITNGGGPGVMATDRAADVGIPLAQLSPQTLTSLTQVLPPTWSHGNPIDMTSQANVEYHQKVISLCLEDPNVDAVLVILTPQATTAPLDITQAIIELASRSPKPILACWMGGSKMRASRELLAQARLPEFRTPESAIDGFSYLSTYHQNQQQLLQTPGPLGRTDPPDVEGARIIIESILAERRTVLTEMESKALLGAFRIPVVSTAIAHNANEALVLAESIGFPVVMKINSPDIPHKSEVGGVKLNITTAQAVREAFRCIMQRVKDKCPEARLDGITVEHMVHKPHGRELLVGVIRDPVFGPVISFGMGGTMVEVLDDLAVSLPPLNRYLANTMINKTRAAKLLGEFRQMPAAKHEALEKVLLRVSEMTCELPWIQEMEINPLIIDEEGVVAVDARIVVNHYTASTDRYAHMAIYPYPVQLVKYWQLPDGTDVTIRPIRPEDADLEQEFIRNLSEESRYFRFMQTMHELTPTMLVRFTHIDYDREMALVVVTEQEGKEVEIGVARYAINPDGESCEFALVVSDQWQHRGIAQKLMSSLLDAAREKGLKVIQGEVLSNNHNMLRLMNKLGFTTVLEEEDRSLTWVSRNL